MTLLVGIRCSDGVVIAADQAVTFGVSGIHTISHRACKIAVISDQVIVAGTGQVGMNQRFCDTVEKMWTGQQAKGKSPIDVGRLVSAAAVKDFQGTGAPKGAYGALMAFPSGKHGGSLIEFQVADLQPEMKDSGTWFVSMGSGQLIADSYLAFMRSVYWQDGAPTVRHALFAAAWVMHQSIAVAPGFIAEPIDIAVLEGSNARRLDEDDLASHMEAAEAATKHFGTFDPESLPVKGAPVEAPPPPEIPSPPDPAKR